MVDARFVNAWCCIRIGERYGASAECCFTVLSNVAIFATRAVCQSLVVKAGPRSAHNHKGKRLAVAGGRFAKT